MQNTKKKNQVQSNPFGIQVEKMQDDPWGNTIDLQEDDQEPLDQQEETNNFFNAQQVPVKQKQPLHKPKSNNPFQQQNNFSVNNSTDNSMQGMINLDGNTNNNNLNQQTEYDEDNEPPLLEDLGINLELIKQRMISVLKLKKCDEQFLVESDMSGPMILGFALGFFMMLAGKIHFGYIYGFGICGTISLYLILNWLSQHRNIALYNVLSILGYGLLPIVILSFFSIFINLVGLFGGIISIVAIAWATYTSSTFFEEVLQLNHQKYLAAYPIFLFYFTFVLITVF